MRLFERLTSRVGFLSRLGKQVLPNFFSGLAVLTEPGRFLRSVAWFLLKPHGRNRAVYRLHAGLLPACQPVVGYFLPGGIFTWNSLAILAGSIGVFEGAVVGALAVFKLDAALRWLMLSPCTSGII